MTAKKARPPLSRRWLWGWMVLLVLLGLAAGLFDFPEIWNRSAAWIGDKTPVKLARFEPAPFRLGLDLLGGSELVYEADLSRVLEGDRRGAVEGVRDVIERRVNSLGVDEPVVQSVKSGDAHRIIIQLAGIKDVNQAINEIGETPVLEFHELASQSPEEKTKYESDLAAAQKIVDDIKEKLRVQPWIAFERLAREAGGAYTDLGFIAKADQPVFWNWASEHRIGNRTATDPIERAAGWYFLELVNSRITAEKEITANHILICYNGIVGCESDISKEDARAKIDTLKAQATSQNFIELAKKNSTEPGAETTGGFLDWFAKGEMVQEFDEAAFALTVGEISEVVETQFGFHIIYKTNERPLREYALRQVFVEKPVVPAEQNWVNTGLSGKHLVRANVEFDPQTGAPTIGLVFNEEGKQLFGDITARNIGKPIGIFLDNSLVSIPPIVQQEIRTGTAVISGTFTVAEAKQYTQRLNAGALPVPIELVSQQTVGATLGQASLEKSLMAGLIGFALVALFMIIYYRIPGVISVIALSLYVIFVLAIFKLIPVTLTLAGIAGFILSIGMAVDANVLIFERMKEELKAGRSLSSAIDEGFRRAWSSIRDGNLTTLISAAALFWFSSSVIKGFALTLAVGVLMSMFSALTITRVLLQLASGWRWRQRLGLFSAARPPETK